MNRLSTLLLFMGIVFIGLHCVEQTTDSEKKIELHKDQLQGAWEVVHAVRDEKPTKLLDNTSFYFTADSMVTNLPSQEGKAAYAWSENEIIRQEGDITTYTVHTLNKDSLEFSVVLQGFQFDMTLQKTNKDSLK